MSPAISQHDWAAVATFARQLMIAGIAINLQDAAKALQELGGEVTAAPIAIKVDHARRIRPAPAALVPRQRPEIAGLGSPSSGIKHRRPGLIHEEVGRLLQELRQPIDHRGEMEPSLADPALPTQPASVERSSSSPERAKIWA